jgi:surface protein
MRKYNITKNLNAYGGRNNYSVLIGTTRNIKGSSNRIYQYCSRISETPLYCMFQIPPRPIRPSIKGFFRYSFIYTGPGTITESFVAERVPVNTEPGVFEATPYVTIIGNNVYVEVETVLYEDSTYSNDLGITFNKEVGMTKSFNQNTKNLNFLPLPIIFYNNSTSNLTFISTNNCPFSKSGSQFSSLNGITISPTFKPYFLPDTSLSDCFNQCVNFNSDISNWDTSNVTNMSYMFYNAISFNQYIGSWNTINVTNMTSMFESSIGTANIFLANKFNNGETSLVNLTGNMSTATYTANTRLLTCSGANFTSELSINDILFLDVSGNIVYYGSVQNITSATNLNLYNLSNFANIGSGNMLSIKKSINGTKPLNWNTVNVTDMSNMFKSCAYFNQSIGSWNTSRVTNMSNMFYQDIIFNNGEFKGQSGNPLLWNTLNVNSMEQTFRLDRAFNQNISTSGDYWNTTNVTTMNGMFRDAYLFNINISNWDTSKNTSMNAMFFQARTFNNGEPPGSSTSPLNWITSNVTIMESTFRQQDAFNQDISSFDTSNVTIMTLMFQTNRVFNQDISNWKLSNVTNMNSMFDGATIFNNGDIPLSSWYAPNCTTFASMFLNARDFNQPLTNLVDTSGVTGCSLANMFQNSSTTIATKFNQNISNWNVSRVTSMASMFQRTTAANAANAFNNGSLTNDSSNPLTWTAPNCTSFASMFQSSNQFNQPLPNLVDTSGVTSCSLASMFQSNTAFNQDINGWNVSNVTTMANMFNAATIFNNGDIPLSSWYAPKCTTFASMFLNARDFNQPLTQLVDTSGNQAGCTLANMFQNSSTTIATKFNQNISNWNVSRVTSMASMFQRTTAANAFNNGSLTNDSSNPLTWTAPNCASFALMFQSSNQFNQPLPNLVDTSGVTSCSLASMFQSNTAFNQDISGWIVSNVTTMANMFNAATIFNNGDIPLSSWYAPKCTTFASMFLNARDFNQPLTNLVDTSGVTSCTLASMFNGARLFNQNISNWNTSKVTAMDSMFLGTTILATTTQFNNGQASGTIPGTAPLNWDTSNVTTMLSMFRYCIAFNQPISKSGSYWDTTNVTTVSQMFQGINATTGLHLFNNGEPPLGETAPLNWTFKDNFTPTNTSWRTNSNLTRNPSTFNNAKTTLQLP